MPPPCAGAARSRRRPHAARCALPGRRWRHSERRHCSRLPGGHGRRSDLPPAPGPGHPPGVREGRQGVSRRTDRSNLEGGDMADTLTSVAAEELQNAQNAQTDVAAGLTQAQSDAAQAQKDLDTANADLKSLNDDAAKIRRQIAETTNAADGDQLFQDLEDKNAEIRAKQAAISQLQEDLADAQGRIASGTGDAAAAAARLKAAQQANDEATTRTANNVLLKNKAAAQPITGLPAAADVTQDPAKTKVKDASDALADVPKDLRDLAHARREYARARADAVVEQAADAADRMFAVGEAAGQAGAAAKAGADF